MDHAFIISCCAVSLPQCRRSAVRHPQLLTPTWTDSDVFSAWHCRLLTSTTHLPRLRTRSHPATSLDRRLDVVAEAETRHRIAVRLTKGDKELERIAWLRADAYYEDQPPHRFEDSFKKMFREQEVRSLKQRTCPGTGGVPECACLVAVGEVDGQEKVLATLDMRPPASLGGRPPMGVPQGDLQGVHVLNVVVDPSCRRQGIGQALMQGAADFARIEWGAASMYTHVQADNEAAIRLYRKCGFMDYDDEGSPYQAGGASSGITLGRRLLLRAALSAS